MIDTELETIKAIDEEVVHVSAEAVKASDDEEVGLVSASQAMEYQVNP